MAQESWPSPGHNNRAVTDLEYELLSHRFSDDGVYGSPKDSPVVTAGTGLSVRIRPDAAGSVRGHGWDSGADADTIPLPSNTSGQTRIDRIVLRLNRADWTVRAALVGGTPGAGIPALTQNSGDTGVWEVPLARVTVLAGAATVSVTREELYVGTRCRPCTSTTRNPTPRLGEQAFETDTGRVIMWDGSAWRVIYYDSGEDVLPTSAAPGWAPDGGTVGQIKTGVALIRLGAFRRTSSSAAGAETRLPVVLPVEFQPPTYWQYIDVYLTGARLGRLTVYSRGHPRAGQIWLTEHPALATGDYIVSTSTSWGV